MGRNQNLDLVRDPHCGRHSTEAIEFTVGERTWKVLWGPYDVLGTPAFWVDQTVRSDYASEVAAMARDTDLLTETVYCLLGGFGVSAESAHAALSVVLPLVEDDPAPTAEAIEELLRRPLPEGRGLYRFPRQRSQRISAAVRALHAEPAPEDPEALRSYLLGLNGVGPKTSAWIVRNVHGSPAVAIIDIWIIRALTHNGVFPSEWRVERDYGRFEDAFLQYAAHGRVEPGALDLCIWTEARAFGAGYFESPSVDSGVLARPASL